MENSRAINKNNLNIDVKADGQIKIVFNNETTLNVDAAKNLYDILKPIFEKQQNQEPALPEEPEEAGIYATQTGLLLAKNNNDKWSYKKPPYDENGILDIIGEEFACYLYTSTKDWDAVVKTIGVDAFPLKRITESDVIALAQSKSEE